MLGYSVIVIITIILTYSPYQKLIILMCIQHNNYQHGSACSLKVENSPSRKSFIAIDHFKANYIQFNVIATTVKIIVIDSLLLLCYTIACI